MSRDGGLLTMRAVSSGVPYSRPCRMLSIAVSYEGGYDADTRRNGPIFKLAGRWPITQQHCHYKFVPPTARIAVLVNTMNLPIQEGILDGVLNGTIRGWAFTRPSVGPPLGGARLLVTCDGIEIAVIRAIEPRDDVANARGCEPTCGFIFVPPAPYHTGRRHAFRFRILPSLVELTHSPVWFQASDQPDSSEVAELRSTVTNMGLQLRALLPPAWPAERAGDVPLDMYAEWAAGYFPALRARTCRARLFSQGRLSGKTEVAQVPSEPVDNAARGSKVSVVLPVFRPQADQFEAAVRSILHQSYEDWELILVDDGSASRDLSGQIQALCREDRRIRAITRLVQGGIAAASNDAVDVATGTFVTFLGQMDALVDVALEVMVNAMMAGGHVAAYSDEDAMDADGRLSQPWLKPDINPRLLLAQDCVGRLLVVRRDALNAAWPLEPDYDEVQDHALALCLTEGLGSVAIHHVAEILYHRRGHAMTALGPAAALAGEACIAAHLRRRGVQADVHAVPGSARFEVEWRSGRTPTASVIVTGGRRGHDLVAFATSLHGRTRYRRMEVLLAGHGLGLGECGHALHQAPGNIRMLDLAKALPRAALLNEAASAATGDYLIFLHDTGLPRSSDWLHLLLEEIQAEERVAVVGCKNLAPDGTVRGGAITPGIDGSATPMHAGLNATDPGYMGRAACAQDVSVVSLDGLLCRADAFRAMGGFDENGTCDVLLAADFCRRLQAEGYRTIWTPAVLIDHGDPDERLPGTERLQVQWGIPDPAYNVNFARSGGTFQTLDGGRLDPTGEFDVRAAQRGGIVDRACP